jgi:hypothetical protein
MRVGEPPRYASRSFQRRASSSRRRWGRDPVTATVIRRQRLPRLLAAIVLAVAGLAAAPSLGHAATTTTVLPNSNYDCTATFAHGAHSSAPRLASLPTTPTPRLRAFESLKRFRRAGVAAEDVGRARVFEFGDLPEGVLGSTDELGNITIRRGLSGEAFEQTLRHETVHSVLTPPAPINKLTVGLYGKSGLYRYAEEALAEGYATRSVARGLAFPVTNGYVSVPRLALEAGGLGAAGYGIYEWGR